MTRVKLNQLEMLVVTVEQGSFSGAAAELGCTQSSISHGIAELERRIGVRLLDRNRSGCVPTLAGMKAFAHARQMLEIADQIVAPQAGEDRLSGRVRLATVRCVGSHVLPFAVEAMAREFPEVHVEIHDACNDDREVTAMVQAGTADIGITRAPVGDDLVARPFIHDDYAVIAPDGIRLSSPACWTELARLPLIRLQQPGGDWIFEQCREQCRAAGLELRASRALTDPRGIVALVARGLGYAVLPQLVAFPRPAGTQILALPFPARRQLVVIARRGVVHSRLVTTAMQCIVDRQVIMKCEPWACGAIGIGEPAPAPERDSAACDASLAR